LIDAPEPDAAGLAEWVAAAAVGGQPDAVVGHRDRDGAVAAVGAGDRHMPGSSVLTHVRQELPDRPKHDFTDLLAERDMPVVEIDVAGDAARPEL